MSTIDDIESFEKKVARACKNLPEGDGESSDLVASEISDVTKLDSLNREIGLTL